MAFLLLVISVMLCSVLFYARLTGNGSYTKLRFAVLYALLANAVLIYLYNETASFFNAVNRVTATVFWAAEVLVLSGVLFSLYRRQKPDSPFLSGLSQVFKLSGLTKPNKLIIVLAALFFVLPLLFLAIYVAPNNYDSHMYHLNRILFWIDNGNLDHFPTMHLQQLYLNMFAEYLVLDTVLLAGSDQFANLVQFGAFIGSLAAITLLAKRLNLGQNGQLLAGIFLLTLPIAIFESTSTQVDFCACFFFIAYVMFGFELLARRSNLVLAAFLLSLTFGGCSKYTVFIFAIPFTVLFALRILFEYKIAYASRVLGSAILCMIVVFGPFFYRNYTLFGHVMHPLRNTIFASEELPANKYGFRHTLSSIVKNAGLHIGLPSTGFNQVLDAKIRDFHEAIGVEVDDRDLTVDPFAVKYSVHEDMVPNTIHFWLIILGTVLLIFVKGSQEIKWLWVCALLSFVMFATLMKFQAWSTRTHMPFFAMGAILTAFLYTRKNWSPLFLALPLLLLSSVFVYGNPSKELLSINFLTRKAIAHIPVAICETGGAQAAEYEKYLGEYYEFPGTDHCHPLKKWLGYAERRKIFARLEKVGYYDFDKASNILHMPRSKAYFLSHTENYESFRPLLDHIEGDHKNIGVFFKLHKGFYHFWSALASEVPNPGQMNYIRYNKELMVLKNAQQEFCYDYILSDDVNSVKAFVPAQNIDTIYSARLLQLVKLKKPSCGKSLF